MQEATTLLVLRKRNLALRLDATDLVDCARSTNQPFMMSLPDGYREVCASKLLATIRRCGSGSVARVLRAFLDALIHIGGSGKPAKYTKIEVKQALFLYRAFDNNPEDALTLVEFALHWDAEEARAW